MPSDLQTLIADTDRSPRPKPGAARLRAQFAALVGDGVDSASGRALSSREAAAVARSCLKQLEITRIARVTGLDRIGMPVWTAIRPNAVSLSVSQGKGVDDDAAVASAIFEAAELTVAERPQSNAFLATPDELTAAGWPLLEASRFLRRDVPQPLSDRTASWLEALDLISGATIAVPEDIVRMADVPGCLYWQTSDGLGIGSNIVEGAIHGLCEIIERDAMALWSLRSDDEIARREVNMDAFASAHVDGVVDKIEAAGLRLRLFDATTDIGVPTFMAVIIEGNRATSEVRYVDLASGSGTHPLASRAALRAITEAVQTRLTTITGSRDDFDPEEYARPLPADLRVYAGDRGERLGPIAVGYRGPDTLAAWLDWIVAQVRDSGIRSVALVELDALDFPFVVTRVIAPGLEQDPRSGNRRPGRRLLAAMMGLR